MEHFAEAIHHWYGRNRRSLPWRETRDPYRIWVSEIILQQTRVHQGLPYYEKFIGHFPDVRSLAEASDDLLMKVWEGLGYYSRARNMKAAAQTIAGQYAGKFPDSYEGVRSLKGIGDYTAAAVVSMAFGLPYPVVDGNVFRFLSRFFGIKDPIDTGAGRKIFFSTADKILDRKNPGLHNQAVMEFGALCCTPRNPDCPCCPLQDGCFAFQYKQIEFLPVKSKKPRRRTRYFYYFIPEDDKHVVIEKRNGKDIWTGLHQFPLFEGDHQLSDEEILSHTGSRKCLSRSGEVLTSISREYVHLLTHQEIRARFIRIIHPLLPDNFQDEKKVRKGEILNFAFPILIKKFILENYTG